MGKLPAGLSLHFFDSTSIVERKGDIFYIVNREEESLCAEIRLVIHLLTTTQSEVLPARTRIFSTITTASKTNIYNTLSPKPQNES